MPLAPLHDPMKPKVVLAPAARLPFHERLLAVTLEPLLLRLVPQDWLTVCRSGKVQETVQPLLADEPAFTVTSAWNPEAHWLTTR